MDKQGKTLMMRHVPLSVSILKLLLILTWAESVTRVLSETTTEESMPEPNLNRTSRLEGRIVNGYEAQAGQFPYIVFWKFGRGQRMCAGTLSDLYGIQFVVTAAHCTWRGYPLPHSSIDRTQIKMYFGVVDVYNKSAPDVQVRRPSKIVVHEGFGHPNTANDISLMFIDPRWELPKTDRIASVEIAPAAYVTPAEVMIMGWGARWTNGPGSNNLLYRRMRTFRPDECRFFASEILDHQFCVIPTQGGPAGTCSGDSGGPVTAWHPTTPNKQFLIGVVSHHIGDCGYCSIYTRISAFGKWISDQVINYKTIYTAGRK